MYLGITTDLAATASFHILTNSLYTNNLIIWHCVTEILTTSLNKLQINKLTHMTSCDLQAVCVAVYPPLLTFECLNQSLRNLVCVSWHLSPFQQHAL
jgi:hypothetical protein